MAALLAVAVALMPVTAAAELSDNATTAKSWQQDKQQNEIDLIVALKNKFNTNTDIQASLRGYATVALTQVKDAVTANFDNGGQASAATVVVGTMGRIPQPSTAPSGDDRTKALAYLNYALTGNVNGTGTAPPAISIDAFGDILWLHANAIRQNHPEGSLGGVSNNNVWRPDRYDPNGSTAGTPGRQRYIRSDIRRTSSGWAVTDAGWDTVRAANDAGDVGGLHAAASSSTPRGPGGYPPALMYTALPNVSVLGRISRAYGLMLGAGISGSTNLYRSLMFAAPPSSMSTWLSASSKPIIGLGMTDAIWKLVPLITLVADNDHTILEVAASLTSHGDIAYAIGNYSSLMPTGSTHAAATQVAAILASATTNHRNDPLYCWYGTANTVQQCRRYLEIEVQPKPFLIAEIYPVFHNATMDTASVTTGTLNTYGYPKASGIFAPWLRVVYSGMAPDEVSEGGFSEVRALEIAVDAADNPPPVVPNDFPRRW